MRQEHEIQGNRISELARVFGTPLFVYDGDILAATFTGLRRALAPDLEVLFSLKSNPNVSVCAVLRAAGAGAEVSSLVELMTARRAGVAPQDIIFLGPGKSEEEIQACVDVGIYAIVAESFDELAAIDAAAARAGRQVPVLLRVNPAFAVKGSKLTMGGKPRQFGIDEDQVLAAGPFVERLQWIRLLGVHVYMGTRILEADVVAQNTERILDLAERVATALRFDLRAVDVGGGLGVGYFDGEADPDVQRLGQQVNPLVAAFKARHPRARLFLELGRFLTATAGLYVVRARYVKTSHDESFVIADGGTNHHMAAVGIGSFARRNFPIVHLCDLAGPGSHTYTITGPLCTPSDTLGKAVRLPAVHPGDLIGVQRSGAYGPSASPGLFLSHGYPAEVLVRNGVPHLVRERDEPEDLLRKQRLLPLDSVPTLRDPAHVHSKVTT